MTIIEHIGLRDIRTAERVRLDEHWQAAGAYANQSVSLALLDARRLCGDVPQCFYCDGRLLTTSTAELIDDSLKVAARLYQRGIRAGDVVAVQLPTWRETLLLYAAVFHLNAVLLPIIHSYGPREVGFILRQSRARLLAVPDLWRGKNYLDELLEIGAVDDLEQVVIVGERLPTSGQNWQAVRWRELCADRASQLPPMSLPDPNRVCLLIYTSGTTADPKGVMHTHNTVIAEWSQPHFVNRGCFLNCFPAGHIGGFIYMMRSLRDGVPMVYLDHWDAELASRLIEIHGVEQASGTPYFLTTLLAAQQQNHSDFSTLRTFGMGGAGVSPAQVELTDSEGFPGGRVYGSSEHPTVTFYNPQMPANKRRGTDGRVVGLNQVRVVSETGEEVAPGTDGEILTRGPELFIGYLDQSLNAECFEPDGWFRTGDIGHLDSDGYLTITDRKKDIIIRGGENLSSMEIEAVTAKHPACAEVAAVGMPDPLLGERVCLFVVLSSGKTVSLQQIQQWFRQAGMAVQKTPEHLEIVAELPRTAAGKVRKHLLRDHCAALAAPLALNEAGRDSVRR